MRNNYRLPPRETSRVAIWSNADTDRAVDSRKICFYQFKPYCNRGAVPDCVSCSRDKGQLKAQFLLQGMEMGGIVLNDCHQSSWFATTESQDCFGYKNNVKNKIKMRKYMDRNDLTAMLATKRSAEVAPKVDFS